MNEEKIEAPNDEKNETPPVFGMATFDRAGAKVKDWVGVCPDPAHAIILDFQCFKVHVEATGWVLILGPDALQIFKAADLENNADRIVRDVDGVSCGPLLRRSLLTIPKRGTPGEVAKGEAHLERVIVEGEAKRVELRVSEENP